MRNGFTFAFIKYCFIFAVVLFLTSCASQQNMTEIPVNTPNSFSAEGDMPAPDRWWTAFGDDSLTAWVDTAISSNFTLRSAWQRLLASQAVAKRARAPLFPTLEADVSADRQRFADSGRITEELSLGLSTVYEIDLWGRIEPATFEWTLS
jgi:outer membrane protein TolC